MATAEQHLQEAGNARLMYQREIASLQRVTTLRAIMVAIIALLTYAHFARVLRLNRNLDAFGSRTNYEQTSTVASFLSAHLEEKEFTLTLTKDSRTLLRILEESDRVLGRTTEADARNVQQVKDVLDAATKNRPDNIRLTLPYFGDVGLPIGYVVLSFLTALASIGFNLFLLLRQGEIRSIYQYIEAHLSAIADPAVTHAHFVANYEHAKATWPGTRIFDTATGVAWRDVSRRRFTLVEFTAATVTLASVMCLLVMAWYLTLETWPIPLGQSVLLAAAAILTLLTALAAADFVRRIGLKMSGSADPL